MKHGKRVAAARERERARHLQKVTDLDGEIWGCAKWMDCGTRYVDTPPDRGPHPDEKCSQHQLPMTTLIAANRTITRSGE